MLKILKCKLSLAIRLPIIIFDSPVSPLRFTIGVPKTLVQRQRDWTIIHLIIAPIADTLLKTHQAKFIHHSAKNKKVVEDGISRDVENLRCLYQLRYECVIQ